MKEYKFKIGGKEYAVEINNIEGSVADVTVNGTAYKVEMEGGQAAAVAAGDRDRPRSMSGSSAASAARGDEGEARRVAGGKLPQPAGITATIPSPLPGVIISIDVKEGQAVKRGQKIAVIEAMKMENDILAPQDGTISSIKVAKGDSVLEGAVIAEIA